MPFSSLTDPVDLARAQAALDSAWEEIRTTVREGQEERERTRLSYIVAAMTAVAEDEDDLKRRAVARFHHSSGA